MIELEATPVAVWKAYLTWHLLESASPWLAKPFADESFAFKDKYLGGATEMKPRAMRCLESTEALLGEPLGRMYAERYFPPAAKAKVQEMVRALLGVLQEEVGGLDVDGSRDQAAGPREARDLRREGGISRRVDRLLGARHSPGRVLGRTWPRPGGSGSRPTASACGQRVSRAIWQLPPSSPDAYIDVQLNLMALPAGFLQAPAFDLAATDAVNYGAIGIGIAHDLTHAIDALGADFDADGPAAELVDGPRSPGVSEARPVHRRSVRRLRRSSPAFIIQGEQVLGEALGDLAGVRLAYRGPPAVDAAPPGPGDRRLQPRTAVLHRLGPVPRRRGEPGAAASDGEGGSAPDLEVPGDRPALECAGVPARPSLARPESAMVRAARAALRGLVGRPPWRRWNRANGRTPTGAARSAAAGTSHPRRRPTTRWGIHLRGCKRDRGPGHREARRSGVRQ